MKLIVDMASIIQTGLRKGDDAEGVTVEHEGRMVKINSAGHGYENAIDYLVHTLDFLGLVPADMILVFEGMDTKKRRLMIDSTYKAKRGKSAPEYYKAYSQCKDMVKAALRSVGAMAVTQDLAEGDDTCGYLSWMCEEDCIVLTNDSDLSVLTGKTRTGHSIQVLNGSDFGKLPENVFETQHISLYKTLVGDSSDSIPGCPGFGPKAWLELLTKYGGDGVEQLAGLIAGNKIEEVAAFAKNNACKLLTKIVDNWNSVYRAWQLVAIRRDWVNNRYYPLRIEPGIVVGTSREERNLLVYADHLPQVIDSRLRKYAQQRRLILASNYDENYELLRKRVEEFPDEPVAFDVETSTDVESSDWMAEQGNPDGVDPIGSYLVGFSLTFGRGGNRTFYASVNHYDTDNISMSQARKMIELVMKVNKPIHNMFFELPVLYFAEDEDGTLWRDHWKKYGEDGFMANVDDTLLMSSYVDENAAQRNLKALSRNVLGYGQTDFNTMRTFRVGEDGSKPYPGGTVHTRIAKEQVFENGVPVYDAKGKVKMRTVKESVPVLDEDGFPVTKRVRNKETGLMEDVPKTVAVPVKYQEVVYKMHELPATAVFDYGCDDTICTSAYHRFVKFHMQLDEHFHVYRDVEIDAAYLHARSYCDGFVLSIAELMQAKRADDLVLLENEKVLHNYLIDKGWAGTKQPSYTAAITPAEIKEAYSIVMGLTENEDAEEDEEEAEDADPVMKMRIRTIPKIIELIAAQDRNGAEVFAWKLQQLVTDPVNGADAFNSYIGSYFDGRPKFAYGNKDKSKLLYDVMGLEVRVRGMVTPAMRKAGIREGRPSADNLAVDYGIVDCKAQGREVEAEVLQALKVITMVKQRNGLYYEPYPKFVHWRTGKVHSSHRQCYANTRRASSATPNMQQVSAHEKIEGFEPRVRAAYQPHKPGAVVVAMDFNAQELRLMADDSRDPNMLACYVGEHKKDMHSITGSMIAVKESEIIRDLVAGFREAYPNEDDAIYHAFLSAAKAEDSALVKLYKEFRGLGKKINFTALYGAMAKKVAMTLMISEVDAQTFLDARAEAFRVSEQWKSEILVEQAKGCGFVRSRLGAKRHLAELFDSRDRSVSSKAERQAANFRIQGSAAEMTKKAEGRMWRRGLLKSFDMQVIGPIHDEVVASIMVDENFFEAIKAMHACMVAPYADMTVEVKSSIEFGPNMQDLIEIGMEPTDDAIAEGLRKLREQYPAYA